DQRHCDLAGDKDSLQPVARAAEATPAFAEYILQIDPRGLQRRNQTEGDCGQRRDSQSEQQNPSIERDFAGSWQSAWEQAEKDSDGKSGEDQTGSRRETSQENTFSKKLANDAHSAGPQRSPNRELT